MVGSATALLSRTQRLLFLLLLGEVLYEIVHDFLPLVLDFLPTKSARERGTLVLHCLGAQRILVDVGDLELTDGLHCGDEGLKLSLPAAWERYTHDSRCRKSMFYVLTRLDKDISGP